MGVEANQHIGDYEVLGVLGAGGMGKVYRVRNVISDRIEAMKVLLPDLAGRQELAARFLREIKLLASLNHPNIATLCTALTIDNQLVMIMEFVEGVTLDELLDQGRISVGDATEYIGQALAALSYAHGKGVVHRDIKPANMMLTPQGIIKVMDFGIARSASERSMTQTGTTLGSVNYMSPEQITGQAVDARSDIYSVGITLYELVTGQRPFNANSDYELMAMHVKEAPTPPMSLQPWIPPALNHIILTAIAKDPNERFQSAEEFRQTLRSAQGAIQNDQRMVTPVRPATMMEMPTHSTLPSTPTAGRQGTMVASGMAAGGQGGDMYGRQGTMVAQSPQFQNVAIATQPPAVNGRRKLYMAGGAFLAIAAVGAPTAYLATHQKSSSTPATATAPAPTPATPPVAATSTTPASAAAPKPEAGAITPKATLPPGAAIPKVPGRPTSANVVLNAKLQPGPLAGSRAGAPAGAANPSAPPPVAAGPPPMTAELQDKLDHLELRIDQDTNQSNAINGSLNNMQAQMQRDGMSIRGDVAAQQSSMNLNMNKAQRALEVKDADRADRFATLAEADIAQLKKFLGR
jgi:serine/threonine protein kinase